MSFFEKYLTLWVFLCIVFGVLLGQLFPDLFHMIGSIQYAQINIPVGLLIWVMIIPMLMRIDFQSVMEVKHQIKGIGVTLFVNWFVKPFSMWLLAYFFIRILFAHLLPHEQIDSYVAGLIILAAAPCTAMVFVWSKLTNGDPLFTLSQVALNDTIMIFAFAPSVAFLLNVSSIAVPWNTLVASVIMYIVIPLIVAQILRRILLSKGEIFFKKILKNVGNYSIGALLTTLVLIFSLQGKQIVEQPLVIALLAIPILIQVIFNSSLAYWLNQLLGEKHNIACPSALIGASNFFELAVATSIGLFGFNSGATLATVVGVLVEVPAMLLVVEVVNNTKNWYQRS